jgi:hypothetical protein
MNRLLLEQPDSLSWLQIEEANEMIGMQEILVPQGEGAGKFSDNWYPHCSDTSRNVSRRIAHWQILETSNSEINTIIEYFSSIGSVWRTNLHGLNDMKVGNGLQFWVFWCVEVLLGYHNSFLEEEFVDGQTSFLGHQHSAEKYGSKRNSKHVDESRGKHRAVTFGPLTFGRCFSNK